MYNAGWLYDNTEMSLLWTTPRSAFMSHQLTHFSNKQPSMKPFATTETNESKTASLVITKQALTIPDISRHLTQHSWANSNVVTKSKAILHNMNDTTGKHTGPEAFCKSSTAMQPKEQENQERREVLTICLQIKNSNFETDRDNLTLTVLPKDCCSLFRQQNFTLILN